MSVAPEIVRLRAAHEGQLARLFAAIAGDPTATTFHPHPFDPREARRICTYAGRDLFFALDAAGEFHGYGMLRGWDEGYAIPSLGIYVAPTLRGSGAACLLMQHLHLAARLSGAPSIRLRVYPDNAAAVALYGSLGYVFDAGLDASGQRVGRLALAQR